jgi:hypothetical protein
MVLVGPPNEILSWFDINYVIILNFATQLPPLYLGHTCSVGAFAIDETWLEIEKEV